MNQVQVNKDIKNENVVILQELGIYDDSFTAKDLTDSVYYIK